LNGNAFFGLIVVLFGSHRWNIAGGAMGFLFRFLFFSVFLPPFLLVYTASKAIFISMNGI